MTAREFSNFAQRINAANARNLAHGGISQTVFVKEHNGIAYFDITEKGKSVASSATFEGVVDCAEARAA